VSGVTRLAAVAGTLLGMGLGVGLGSALGESIHAHATFGTHSPVGPAGVWVAVGVGSFAFAVLFRARPTDVPTIVLSSALAFAGGRLGTDWLGPEVGGLLGALVLGLLGNGTARWTRRPASTIVVPGLMVLVPGSVGFRSVAQFLEADALSGIETAFRAAIVATSLVGGLLAANLALPPRRSL
ncbi:MAG: threonine/serine exporter family protein, partial [Planctomycetota bacterium]